MMILWVINEHSQFGALNQLLIDFFEHVYFIYVVYFDKFNNSIALFRLLFTLCLLVRILMGLVLYRDL